MVFSGLITALVAALCCAPGVMLSNGNASLPGQRLAFGAMSLILVLLITAIAGIALNFMFGISIPAWSIMPVAIVILGAVIMRQRRASSGKADSPATARGEWQAAMFAVLFAVFGLFTHWLGVTELDDGSLAVHAWFNADWFKHLGHVSALANYGVPAKDIFQGGEPLYYYWLFYLLPGAVVSLGASPWTALIAVNVLCSGFLAALLYFTIRIACAHRMMALVIAIAAVFVCAPVIYVGYIFSAELIQQVMTMADPPKGPPLLAMAQYIPQHALAVIAYLAWLVLYQPGSQISSSAKWFALIAFAAIMTISVLLGAMLLAAYGLQRLWDGRGKAVPELSAMVVLSGLLVLILGVVQISDPSSAIASPLLTDPADPQPLLARIFTNVAKLVGGLGLPFIAALVVLVKWKPDGERALFARNTCIALFAACFVAAIAGEAVMTERLAKELLIRAINLPPIGIALIGGALLSFYWARGGRTRTLSGVAIAVFILAALPSTIFRTAWHANIGDAYTTIIPADDRKVLAALREQSLPTDQVWQYPEPPFLNEISGDDNWTAIIAGRTVPASLRATNYGRAAPVIAQATEYFSGSSEAIPETVNWVYLSRKLHPETYDPIATRLTSDATWNQRECYADACLFERSVTPIQ